MSQIPGIKANIDNIIQTALPILDAEGYAICLDCDSRVNCGTISLANLEKCHCGKKICEGSTNNDEVILLYIEMFLIR